MTLIRWNEKLPPGPDNLVLLMQSEAQKLMEGGQAAFSPEVRLRIESRLSWAARVAQDIYYPTNEAEMTRIVKPPEKSWNLSVFCFGVILGVVVSRALIK